MKIEKALCPHCGAPIRIRPGRKVMNCEYCDMQIIISDLELEEEDVAQETPLYEEKDDTSGYVGRTDFSERGSSRQSNGPHFTDFSRTETDDYNKNRSISYKSQNSSVPGKQGYWTPVGFRSRRLLNMILAGFFYFVMIFGVLGSSSDFGENILFALFLLFTIGIIFSWQPLIDHLPGLRKGKTSMTGFIKAAYIFAALVLFGMSV